MKDIAFVLIVVFSVFVMVAFAITETVMFH